MSALPDKPPASDDAAIRLALAKEVYRFRRARMEIFNDRTLFGEPAYDILLDLYVAHHERRRVTISDACAAADAPWTTALRHLTLLQNRGFVRRVADQADRRRIYIVLEPHGLSALERLLDYRTNAHR